MLRIGKCFALSSEFCFAPAAQAGFRRRNPRCERVLCAGGVQFAGILFLKRRNHEIVHINRPRRRRKRGDDVSC